MTTLTVVGGGLGGLVAAISGKEAGFDVTLYEAHKELGGRARTTPGVRRANWGPHVVYSDGLLWSWLDERGLARPARRAPATPKVKFRVSGDGRLVPPPAFVRAIMRLRKLEAPVEESFGSWAAAQLDDPAAARRIANATGVFTFDHDPGRLSAAFVNERLRRGTSLPPSVRYMPGGWGTMVDRLASHARRIGVRIETASPVDRLPAPPVILAVPLDRAAGLLGDPSVAWTGTRTALLDLGLRRRRGDAFIVSDLDSPGWVERFSQADPSLAPPGEQLVQAQAGVRPGESLESAVTRLEGLVDVGYHGWRDRETWRRRLIIEDDSGALDPPGTTWRDRPRGDRGDGVHLVGDMVAAPGLLSEVSVQSAVDAVARLAGTPRLTRVA
jgi:phytoene dehydrogenase-like protein